MTNIMAGSDEVYFRQRGNVVDYILGNILANKNRKLGTEWEMFFVDEYGKAITRENGQKAFIEFKKVLSFKGYKTSFLYERDLIGQQTISGIEIDGLGSITPEMGHQFEFSCTVCESLDDVKEKNEEFFDAVTEVAARLNYVPIFRGHVSGYAESTQGSYRSRSVQWHEYFNNRFGDNSLRVCETLDATSSTQVTIDSGAEKFHEFFQVLLLIEPALTIHYANSNRRNLGVCHLPASHIKPVLGAWGARTPKEAVEAIVDRLMQVEVPFLPDPEYPEIYKAEPLMGHCPPTVEDLLMQGRLNEKSLNNVGGFLLSRPALRRFPQGVMEMRGVDSQPTPEKVTEVAQRINALVYNDKVREGLLEDYAHLTTLDIYKMHHASTLMDEHDAFDAIISGMRMIDFINDILGRSESGFPLHKSFPTVWENRAIA